MLYEEGPKPRVPMYTGWQILLPDVILWRWLFHDWVNQPNKLLSAAVSLLLSYFEH